MSSVLHKFVHKTLAVPSLPCKVNFTWVTSHALTLLDYKMHYIHPDSETWVEWNGKELHLIPRPHSGNETLWKEPLYIASPKIAANFYAKSRHHFLQ